MNHLIYSANGQHALRACLAFLVLAFTPLAGCGSGSPSSAEDNPFRILEIADHDRSLFTQGLEIADGYFYESAGLYGQSLVRRYLPSGEITAQFQLPDDEFAEGLSLKDELLVLLTWQNRKVYFLDKDTLQTQATKTISSEGWGAAFVGDRLAVSNGSDVIDFYSLAPFQILSKVRVVGFNRNWQKINELEYAKGLLWANIWQEHVIVAINPDTGIVEYQFDLTEIVEQNTQIPYRESLNGIAYDQQRDAFWLTGKLWQKRYLVEFDLGQ